MIEADAFAFNNALRATDRLADCATLFREAIVPFGFTTYACGEFDFRDRDRNVFYIIDWPESWRQFYVGSGMIHRDPLLDMLPGSRTPFTWSDLRAERRLSKAGTDSLNRAAAEGWTEGLAVPMAGAGHRMGLVSLVGNRPIDTTARHYLTLISVCLHHHARTLVSKDGFPLPPAGLSQREIEAIGHVARGLSDAGIGAAMGVAKSTAHEFVEKARAKLKVRNRAELIALAVSLSVIDL